MRNFKQAIVTLATLSLSTSISSLAHAADAALPAKAKLIAEVPFFSVIDDRLTYSWMPKGTDPGAFTVRPDGSINGKTAMSVYSFTHFDVWAYGTNFFLASLYKSDHNDPAGPCVAPGLTVTGGAGGCAGATDMFAMIRSTFGFNEIFDTKAFTYGPLRNVSLEVGVEAESENTFLAPNHRAVVAGLQFAFDLPYRGYFNFAPLVRKEWHHNAFIQCGFVTFNAGVDCTPDGNRDFSPQWAIETNWYMDLGFLPENMQYFSISGRAALYGPKGNQNAPLTGTGVGRFSTETKTEFNSEPIRLTFDASKAVAGPKYSHFVDVWVAYRYWQNKLGLDHNASPGVCTVAATGQSTNSCTESTVYTGITMKF
ncbi:hypothetical protein OZ411_15340 [Bradyrhizobium sp. Arg237L]|uniref:hypothetical protein n=1 Tax=Bradyrhizobium sp. Arg237L TaxID=3003352 RepID=UPI00249EDE33|nr:hypothetical protein [Bradyrhizobium sp. Arg237L]MDI4234184.1 hypothetical protein [Bradyrhizobium sp. Arg237L]